MIITLRTAAAEIRRAIADSGAGAILAAYFTPVLADIASSVRTDAVAWLEGFPGRHRRAEVPFRLPPAQVAPGTCPVRARAGRGDGVGPAPGFRPRQAVPGLLPEAGT